MAFVPTACLSSRLSTGRCHPAHTEMPEQGSYSSPFPFPLTLNEDVVLSCPSLCIDIVTVGFRQKFVLYPGSVVNATFPLGESWRAESQGMIFLYAL